MRTGAGFTIIELLIVIVVIAILAAITIVAYNGITKQATESTMKSDLRNAAVAVELDNTQDGSYPSDAASANQGKGLSASGENVLSYAGGVDTFCVKVTSPRAGESFHVNSVERLVTSGPCGGWTGTVAGSRQLGVADGLGRQASFYHPIALDVDRAGTLFVVDGNAIRKVSPTGEVTTFAGPAFPAS